MQTAKNQRSPKLAAAKRVETIPVEFILVMPQARSVAVAGSFNNWDASRAPLQKAADGTWKTILPLSPGRYEYRFVADDQWLSDPKAEESVPNSFGSENSVRIVAKETITTTMPTLNQSQRLLPMGRELRA